MTCVNTTNLENSILYLWKQDIFKLAITSFFNSAPGLTHYIHVWLLRVFDIDQNIIFVDNNKIV